MKENVFVKLKDDCIYLDGILVGDVAKLVNIIMQNSDVRYSFKGFDNDELKGIGFIVSKYNKYLKCKYKREYMTIVTHSLRCKVRKYCLLDDNFFDLLSCFEDIERINFMRLNNNVKVVIDGTFRLYGIMNEYGFYDIDRDDFISKDEIREKKNIVIQELENENMFHYVRKRVR